LCCFSVERHEARNFDMIAFPTYEFRIRKTRAATHGQENEPPSRIPSLTGGKRFQV